MPALFAGDAVLRLALLARAACWPRASRIPRDLLLATLELPPDAAAWSAASAMLDALTGAELRPAGRLHVRLLRTPALRREIEHALDAARPAVERTLVAAADAALADGSLRRLRPWAADLRVFADLAIAAGRRDLLAVALARAVGAVSERLGDLDAAHHYFDLALSRCDAGLDADATVRADLLMRLAGAVEKRRTPYDDAIAASYAGLAVDFLATTLGERHLLTASAHLLHGRLRLARDDFAGAQESLSQALTARQALLPSDDVRIAEAQLALGQVYVRSGNPALALRMLRQALAKYDERGDDDPLSRAFRQAGVARSAASLAAALAMVGDMEAAVHYARGALEARQAAGLPDDQETADLLLTLGQGCVACGDPVGGRAALLHALEILTALHGPEAAATAGLRAQIADLDDRKLRVTPPTWN